jgi:hypothetical protein
VTLKHSKTKQERALNAEVEQLELLLIAKSKVEVYTHAFVRNQARFTRGERIAPPTPSAPDPVLAALEYQHNDLLELAKQLGHMSLAVTQLQRSNREARATHMKGRPK